MSEASLPGIPLPTGLDAKPCIISAFKIGALAPPPVSGCIARRPNNWCLMPAASAGEYSPYVDLLVHISRMSQASGFYFDSNLKKEAFRSERLHAQQWQHSATK
jgi:hypothetical protein